MPLGFVLCLLIAAVAATQAEVTKTDSDVRLDTKSEINLSNGNQSDVKLSKSELKLDSAGVDKGKEEKDLSGRSEVANVKDPGRSNSSKEIGSEEVPEARKDEDRVSKESPLNDKDKKAISNEGSDTKKGANEGSDSKEMPKEGTKKEASSISKPLRKENTRVEECHPSNRCMDKKNNLIACLRVPGNESPELSLLIQNRGNGSLTVEITAPNFVQLEKTTIELQEKEDKQVKVSLGDIINGTAIVLATGKGNCSLNFQDMLLPNLGKETEYAQRFSRYSNTIPGIPIIFVPIFVVLLIGLGWTIIRFWRKNSSEYEKLGMELPVSSVVKVESGITDGWDNSWGDSWDDEEAPMTPSKPVSNWSSKGLASRRSNNKDGWQNNWKD